MAKEETLNEFDGLEEEIPSSITSEVPGGQGENLIGSGSPGQVYDWNTAPEGIKAPPRVDMDGKIVVIKKADIIIPPLSKEWSKTKAGDKEFKYCTFVLFYDFEGQQEFYSGVRTFRREDNKCSHPTMTRDRKNQASQLLGLYADFKGKDINEISLKEFMAFLNQKPKAEIKTKEVINPKNDEVVKKNIVEKFVQ